jgi:hypothetical protein
VGGSGHGLVEVVTRHLPGGIEENDKKETISAVPTGIRTECLLNTNLESY